MKRYCPFARYKDIKQNEGFDYFNTFREATNWILKVKDNPKNSCFDLWGIDVFDVKKDDYTHHYILVNGIFELRSS